VVEALARELVEEGNIEILEPPVLHGMFFNNRCVCRAFLPAGARAGTR
jgi:hypothetical protein